MASDIAEKLGVSRSSVSLWTRDVPFTPDPERTRNRRSAARRRGPNALQRRKQEEIEHLLAEGAERIGHLSEREFLVAGVALYAGEGKKTDGDVALANTDPRLIALFCAWLRGFFPIDETRLRVYLYLHEGLDLDQAIAYWSTVTRIPTHQFPQPYRAVADAGIRNSKHPLGWRHGPVHLQPYSPGGHGFGARPAGREGIRGVGARDPGCYPSSTHSGVVQPGRTRDC